MYKSAGIVTQLERRAACIAAKIAGRYWMYWGEGAIQLATSDDAIHWTPVEDTHGNPVELLRPRPGHFDSTFPETGPPPVLTSAGIVMLYNGKNATEGGDPSMGPNAYAAGEALFDAANPAHLLEQTDKPVLKPELPYEKTGQYAAGTTFAEGLVFFHGKWFLYYGCADSLVAVATAPAEAMSAETLHMATAAEGPMPVAGPKPGVPPPALKPMRAASICTTATPWCSTATASRSRTTTTSGSSSTRQRASRWMRVHFYGAGVGGDRVTRRRRRANRSAPGARCVRGEADRRHGDAGHERRRISRHHRRDRADLCKGISSICSIRFANMCRACGVTLLGPSPYRRCDAGR